MSLAPGVWGVLATPFTPDGTAVDTKSLARQAVHYEHLGATGLTVLGVFGEAVRLTPAERRTVVDTVVAACNLPLVVGISSLALDDVLAEAANVVPAALDRLSGLMIQVSTPDPDALGKHLATVAQETDRPLVVQDYPVITGIPIATTDLVHAVQAVPQIVAVKSESSPSPPAVAILAAALDIPVFGGLGGTCLLDELAVGAAGAMTGFSVPEGLLACVTAYSEGGFDRAREVWRDYLPLVNFEFQSGIALGLRKHSLLLRGLIASDAVRTPGAVPPPEMLRVLLQHLARTPGVELRDDVLAG
ncbi:dihydrodipicolinate synthase family protein [Kribbella sp. NPDC051770]|uniref:dihydrodipicolinate synthase family protein n=1 Tax=Kribbella sp. NPDC051770 TaxID=3155413 RepID=UPI00342BF001